MHMAEIDLLTRKNENKEQKVDEKDHSYERLAKYTFKVESESRMKDSTIAKMRLQWGELKDQNIEKDKEIKELKEQIAEHNMKISDLKIQIINQGRALEEKDDLLHAKRVEV